MPMDVKKSLADWQKAKPLLLTKTGVSEQIRSLLGIAPATPDEFVTAIKKFESVRDSLDNIAKGPRLKSENAARRSIDNISLQIGEHVHWLRGRETAIKTTRGTVRSQLGELGREGDQFFQLYQGDKLRIQDATAFEGSLSTRATTISTACVKAGISEKWRNEFDSFSSTQRTLLQTQIIPAMRRLARGVNGGPKTLPGLAKTMATLHQSVGKAGDHLEAPVPFSY